MADEPDDLRGIRSRGSVSGSLSIGPATPRTFDPARDDAAGSTNSGQAPGEANRAEEPAPHHGGDGRDPTQPPGTDFGPAPPSAKTYNVYSTPLDPPRTAPAVHLASDITAEKPANYIFTVGKPGSGKTTLQGHLLHYLFKKGHHDAEPDPEYMSSKDYFQKVRVEWDQAWRDGRFPERTQAGRPAEFRYIVTPLLKRNRDPLLFGFLEISGEDFSELIKPTEGPPALLPSIDEFLANPHCKLAFLFVCRGNHPSGLDGDDLLFVQFLDYLSMRIKRPVKATCCAALVFADPDACQRRLQQRMGEPQDGGPFEIERFVKYFTPQTYARLLTWPRKATTLAPFSLGTVRREQGPDGEEVVRSIVDADFQDAQELYEWLYEQFTGRSIGPSRMEKLKVRLRWLMETLQVRLRRLGGE